MAPRASPDFTLYTSLAEASWVLVLPDPISGWLVEANRIGAVLDKESPSQARLSLIKKALDMGTRIDMDRCESGTFPSFMEGLSFSKSFKQIAVSEAKVLR